MYLNITRTKHQGKPKPKGAEIARIQNEIKQNTEDLTPSEVLTAITKDKRHYQATATKYVDVTGSKVFQSARLVVLDIDNDVTASGEQLTARTLITFLDQRDLKPLTVYPTDSHQNKHFHDGTPREKLRVVFQLPEVITDQETYRTLTKALTQAIVQGTRCSAKAIDNASERPAQLFYGSDKGSIVPEEVGAFILDDEAKNQPYESLEPIDHVRLVDVFYDYTREEKNNPHNQKIHNYRTYKKTLQQLVKTQSPQEYKENIPTPDQIREREISSDFLPYLKLLQSVERGVWIEGIEHEPENLDHTPKPGTRLRGDILWHICNSLDYIEGGISWIQSIMEYHIQKDTRDLNGEPVYKKEHITKYTNYRKYRGKSGIRKYHPTHLSLISPYPEDHQYQNILKIVPEGKGYRPYVIDDTSQSQLQELENASESLAHHLQDVWDKLHEEEASGTPKTAPIVSGIRVDVGTGKTRALREKIQQIIIQAYKYDLGLRECKPDLPVIACSTHLLKNEFLDDLTEWIDDFKESQEYQALKRKSSKIINPELDCTNYILTTPEVPKPPENVDLPGNTLGLYSQLLRAYQVKSDQTSEKRKKLIKALEPHSDQPELREFKEELRAYGKAQQQVYKGNIRYERVVLTTHAKALETDESGIYSIWNDPNTSRGRHLIFDEEPASQTTTIDAQTRDLFKSIFSDEKGNFLWKSKEITTVEEWMNSDRTAIQNPLYDRKKYTAPLKWIEDIEQTTGLKWESIQKKASDKALEQGTSNPLDILDATFLVKDTEGNITGKTTQALPYLQYTILSDSIDKKTLKRLFSENIREDESNLHYIDTPPVKLLGRIHQRPLQDREHNQSHSKASINRTETRERITEDLKDKTIGAIITYKEAKQRYNEALDLEAPAVHYGNTLGSNELRGTNTAIIGEWNLPEHEIINLYLLDNPETEPEKLDLRKGKVQVTRHGITATMWTYKNEGLRDIHLREDEKQLRQAIGRARAVRENVDVYVYARIPLPTYWTSGRAKEPDEAPSEKAPETYTIKNEPPPKSNHWNPWEQPNPPPPSEG